LKIIKYRRVKNLIVLREAIPSQILVTIEHSNCFIAIAGPGDPSQMR